MSNAVKKILIIGPSWVGDMVMAQSLFIDIKQREPGCQIDVLAPAWTAALLDRMPEVTELIAGNFNHGKLSLGERIKLGKSLRSNGYSNVVDGLCVKRCQSEVASALRSRFVLETQRARP